MRDAVRNKERLKGRRTPTQDPSTNNSCSRAQTSFDEKEFMEKLPETMRQDLVDQMYVDFCRFLPISADF